MYPFPPFAKARRMGTRSFVFGLKKEETVGWECLVGRSAATIATAPSHGDGAVAIEWFGLEGEFDGALEDSGSAGSRDLAKGG